MIIYLISYNINDHDSNEKSRYIKRATLTLVFVELQQKHTNICLIQKVPYPHLKSQLTKYELIFQKNK